MSRDRSRVRRRPRQQRVLVFGEDENDKETVRQFIEALCPSLTGKVAPVRHSPVLLKDVPESEIPSRVERICALIDAEQAVNDVIAIFIHEDCDAVHPSHQALYEKIRIGYEETGYTVIPVTPSWETESWLFLWPQAMQALRPKWASASKYRGRDTGYIENAKEELRRALRPSGAASGKVRDYRESDAPQIAAKVRELGVVGSPEGTSASWNTFSDDVARLCNSLQV